MAALEGAGMGLGLLLPFVLVRGLGAGDWKLIGSLGAWLGPAGIVLILLVSIFIAGLMALVEMVRTRRAKETFVNLWVLAHATFAFGVRPPHAINLDNPRLMTLPFGIAVALATVILFLYGVWPRIA
jgi:prepilin peptidase CpaA